jgi:hypothetical protein
MAAMALFGTAVIWLARDRLIIRSRNVTSGGVED